MTLGPMASVGGGSKWIKGGFTGEEREQVQKYDQDSTDARRQQLRGDSLGKKKKKYRNMIRSRIVLKILMTVKGGFTGEE